METRGNKSGCESSTGGEGEQAEFEEAVGDRYGTAAERGEECGGGEAKEILERMKMKAKMRMGG